MFSIKNVSIELIPKIETIKEELRDDYLNKVIPQVPGDQSTPDFDYLFEFNKELFMKIYHLLTQLSHTKKDHLDLINQHFQL